MADGDGTRTVFVTVGTTRFDKLVAAVLAPAVLQELAGRGYRRMTVQFGREPRQPAMYVGRSGGCAGQLQGPPPMR